jgi:uncharacterized membrane protein HdeD (DUF308 family)
MKEKERSFFQRIYTVRAGLALAWALALVLAGSELRGATTALLIAYPAIDVVASLVDARDMRTRVQWLNAAISAAAVAGVAVAAGHDDAQAVLWVFGAWALVSGAVQLGVALVRRRRLAGQLPMILSGGISTIAGVGFLSMASADDPKFTTLAGYATLGAIFYLVSAWGQRRPAQPGRELRLRGAERH